MVRYRLPIAYCNSFLMKRVHSHIPTECDHIFIKKISDVEKTSQSRLFYNLIQHFFHTEQRTWIIFDDIPAYRNIWLHSDIDPFAHIEAVVGQKRPHLVLPASKMRVYSPYLSTFSATEVKSLALTHEYQIPVQQCSTVDILEILDASWSESMHLHSPFLIQKYASIRTAVHQIGQHFYAPVFEKVKSALTHQCHKYLTNRPVSDFFVQLTEESEPMIYLFNLHNTSTLNALPFFRHILHDILLSQKQNLGIAILSDHLFAFEGHTTYSENWIEPLFRSLHHCADGRNIMTLYSFSNKYHPFFDTITYTHTYHGSSPHEGEEQLRLYDNIYNVIRPCFSVGDDIINGIPPIAPESRSFMELLHQCMTTNTINENLPLLKQLANEKDYDFVASYVENYPQLLPVLLRLQKNIGKILL